MGGVVNIYTTFEVIWTKSNFMSNLGFLGNLLHQKMLWF